MLILGEVAVAMGNTAAADQRLRWVCSSNAKAVGAYFLRGYIAWKDGNRSEARSLLERASAARGTEWKPKGSVLEGDVNRRMHAEAAFLSSYWDRWDGSLDPGKAFEPLRAYLAGRR